MDKINPKDDSKLQEAYERIVEAIPYDGSHIGKGSSLAHIKKLYGNKYQIVQMGTAYQVHANMNGVVIPVSTPMDKAGASKFMEWLNNAEKDQQQMIGTIEGGKRLREETKWNLSVKRGGKNRH